MLRICLCNVYSTVVLPSETHRPNRICREACAQADDPNNIDIQYDRILIYQLAQLNPLVPLFDIWRNEKGYIGLHAHLICGYIRLRNT
jgi:hypothetical protein